jgi:hypothetical protein
MFVCVKEWIALLVSAWMARLLDDRTEGRSMTLVKGWMERELEGE